MRHESVIFDGNDKTDDVQNSCTSQRFGGWWTKTVFFRTLCKDWQEKKKKKKKLVSHLFFFVYSELMFFSCRSNNPKISLNYKNRMLWVFTSVSTF